MRGSKGILGLVLLVAIALVVSVPAGSAAGRGGDTAVAAKKKCKKKPHAAKKKKCKKKKKKAVAPVVRATLTWTGAGSNDADLDLFAFDAQGGRAGNGSDTIPATQLSPDVRGTSGSETFTDLDPNQHRAFSFGVCYQVGGSVHAPFTITINVLNGQTHTASRDPGSSFHYDFPTVGVPIPAGYCPN